MRFGYIFGPPGSVFWAAEGDSRTVGVGTSPQTNYVNIATGSGTLPRVTGHTNIASSGATLSTVNGRTTTTDALIASNPGYSSYILSLFLGVNDAPNAPYDTDPAGYLAAIAAYHDARRAAGWKTIACTELPAFSGGQASAYSSWRTTFNAGVRTWQGVHCDAIADFAADPTIGVDGAQLDASLYSGSIHPINPAQAIMATIMEGAMLSL